MALKEAYGDIIYDDAFYFETHERLKPQGRSVKAHRTYTDSDAVYGWSDRTQEKCRRKDSSFSIPSENNNEYQGRRAWDALSEPQVETTSIADVLDGGSIGHVGQRVPHQGEKEKGELEAEKIPAVQAKKWGIAKLWRRKHVEALKFFKETERNDLPIGEENNQKIVVWKDEENGYKDVNMAAPYMLEKAGSFHSMKRREVHGKELRSAPISDGTDTNNLEWEGGERFLQVAIRENTRNGI